MIIDNQIHDQAKVLATFLHETSHLKDWELLPVHGPEFDDHVPGPENIRLQEVAEKNSSYINGEDAANLQKNIWLTWLDGNRQKYGGDGQTWLERSLNALMHYPESVEDFISRKTRECAEKGFSQAHIKAYVTLSLNRQFGDATKAMINPVIILEDKEWRK
jgi:hypothetical protein